MKRIEMDRFALENGCSTAGTKGNLDVERVKSLAGHETAFFMTHTTIVEPYFPDFIKFSAVLEVG